jgi:formylglycine-generating enzyme required for sulfatase activity
MLRKSCYAVLLLFAVYALIACGKKEEAAKKESVSESPTETKPAINPDEMVLIPAGEFIFGSSEDPKSSAYPQQKINLPAFWIDKYEVTNSQFLDFSIKTGYATEGSKEGKDWRLFFTKPTEQAMLPVVFITWKDAQAYCKSLGKRLPTEEEWEKAARGTDGRRYPWGNEWDQGRTNTYEAGPGKPVAIGQYDDASPYGVHDMLGNVQEWTSSVYAMYKGNPKTVSGTEGQMRVVRGLSARYKARLGHLWDRSAYLPAALYDFGCRCAKNTTPEEAAQTAAQRK